MIIEKNEESRRPELLSDAIIRYLIMEADDYKVIIDHEYDIDWETSASFDDSILDSNDFRSILNRIAVIECIPNTHHQERVRINFKRIVGEGLSRALEADYSNANKILDNAENYINSRNVELARCWQIIPAFFLMLIFCGCIVVFWILRKSIVTSIGELAFYVALAFLAGTIGAFISMALRMGLNNTTSEAPLLVHIAESICRIFVGGFLGVIIAALVKIGIILALYSNTNNLHTAMLIASFASGSSERIAPSLIARFNSVIVPSSITKEAFHD